MGYLAFCIVVMVAWRLYDGRGYPLSEAAGWVIGVYLGALTFGAGATWTEALCGAGIGLLATWCIVRGYNGWDQWAPMARRSLPALGLLPLAMVAGRLGLPAGPIILAVVFCLAANITQVPLRRWQHRMDATPAEQRPYLARWSAHICEGYEAVWIGAAIAVAGWPQG